VRSTRKAGEVVTIVIRRGYGLRDDDNTCNKALQSHDDYIEWVRVIVNIYDPFQYYPMSDKKEENLVNDRYSQKSRVR
jgi:hypothetical protein